MTKINLGIIGVADVLTKSIVPHLNKVENLNIIAVASRSIDKAKAFADQNGISNYYEGYEKLLLNKDIDAVYIPLITSLHADWTIKAIEAGKHVLVEKPICLNSEDIFRLSECVKKHSNIVILEGLMSLHHPFNNYLSLLLKNKTFGNLKSISTKACYNLTDEKDFRLFPEKGGSVFFEEGLLWCHLTQLCFGLDILNFEALCLFNGPNKGDQTFQTKMHYPNGCSSELFCSYANPYQADHFLEFDEARIKIKNFWRPTFGNQKLKVEINRNNSTKIEYHIFEDNNYFYNQLRFFVDVILGKEKNVSLDLSFERIKLMERVYNSTRNK